MRILDFHRPGALLKTRFVRQRKFILADLMLLVFFMPYILFALVDPTVQATLGREDGLIENVGAAFYAFAFLTMCYAYAQTARNANKFFNLTTKRNIWFLLLAIVFFTCFGEEISWGQRIFGWQTPQLWAGLNAQSESNIHNLWILHYHPVEGASLNLNCVLTLFCFTYCFIVPVLVKTSKRCQKLSQWLGLPVPSVFIGCLFLANWISYKLVPGAFNMDFKDQSSQQNFEELKETCLAAVFFALALYFAFSARSNFKNRQNKFF